MTIKKKCVLLCVIMMLALPLAACEKEGGAEKAGKKIDQALDSAKDKFHEATK